MIRLILPYPPSINTYYRKVGGRVLISKEGRAYRKRVAQECIAAGVRKPFHGPLEVSMEAQPPDRRRRDLDNLQKAVWDALNHSGCYDDDSQIKHLTAHMMAPMKGGQIRVTVRPYRIIEPAQETPTQPEPEGDAGEDGVIHRDIPSWPGFKATSEGHIIGLRGKPLAEHPHKDDYLRVATTRADRHRQQALVHTLVAEAFHGPRPEGTVIAHLDGDRTNNRPDNLQYISQRENIAHKNDHGTMLRGDAVHCSKLTAKKVLEIRKRFTGMRHGEITELGREYGVSAPAVRQVLNFKAWAHIDDDRPRGIRNNNPGLLRKTSDQWEGLATHQPDSAFFTFFAGIYGIRALAKVLLSYQERYGLRTIRSIITRWAPPSENDTGAYIRSIAQQTEFDPDEELDLQFPETMFLLVEAIITHENGIQPYSLRQIERGLSMAGLSVDADAS